MFSPLDEAYLKWLYTQVANSRTKNPEASYWNLMRHLYTTEFTWFIPNDDNRVEDGKHLRYEFLQNKYYDHDQNWLEEGASFLEMLVALSRRLSFQVEGVSSTDWFWEMLNNVNIAFNDATYILGGQLEGLISNTLTVIKDRTYDFDGKGGLFPLKYSEVDQRQIELWYQINYYLTERS